MATWIAHLRIAEKLLDKIGGLDEAYFGIGNIAPDSGLPDEKWEHFDPPPQITHFHSDDPKAKHLTRDLDFYRRYLAGLEWPGGDVRQFSFTLGYFFHLITDNLWSEKIGAPTKARHAAEFEADNDFIWEVKRDWYGHDFIYVRDNPDGFYWRVFLKQAYTEDYLDFLPTDAIQRNVEYIQENYQRKDERVLAMYARPFIYLSKEAMEGFIAEATDTLANVYRLIWEQGVDTARYKTALDLPGLFK